MLRQRRILLLGGDARSLSMANSLSGLGAQVITWGLRRARENGLAQTEDWRSTLLDSHAVVLPMPAVDGEGNVSMIFGGRLRIADVLQTAGGKMPVFGGRVDNDTAGIALACGCCLRDYAASEEIQIRNAIPTAEGAICLAMQELDITLHRSRVAVLGYGRIGEALVQRLIVLGAQVSVGARKRQDLARIEGQRCRKIDLSQPGFERELLQGYDVVFNTVPARLIDNATLAAMPRETLLMELASYPGGWDALAPCSCHVIYAPGLPAKHVPRTAGELLAHEMIRLWKEVEGV